MIDPVVAEVDGQPRQRRWRGLDRQNPAPRQVAGHEDREEADIRPDVERAIWLSQTTKC